MAKGTGYIDISVDALHNIAGALPSTYEVIGSAESVGTGLLRLKVTSDMLVGDGNQLRLEVKDAGSTRRVLVLPD